MRISDWSADVCSSDLGLLILCTAPAEAEMRPSVGEDLRVLIAALDQLLESRLEAAAAKGELWPHITPAIGAHAAQAMLQSLAIRVRAGESDADLRKMISSAITLIDRSQALQARVRPMSGRLIDQPFP